MTQIKELVTRGSGYTILSSAATFGSTTRGELVSSPIVEPTLIRPIYLVRTPPGRNPMPAAKSSGLLYPSSRIWFTGGYGKASSASARGEWRPQTVRK